MHDAPLLSSHWYRVGHLHARIQPGTRVHRHVVRGREWFVFTHPLSGRHHRLNRKAYELAGRLDGERTLDTLWQGLQSQLGEDAPTQDEMIAMLAQMSDAGLVLFDTTPDWNVIHPRQRERHVRERRSALNPFSFRLRLLDPSPLVERLSFLHRFLWHPLTGVLCALLLGWALFRLALDWQAVSAYAAVHMLTPRSLLLAWLLYPLLKAVHELAHALAVRHYGGEVKEAGIGFLVLMPAPYVDASAAIAFPSKWQRAAVSSAGILVELTVAALAFFVWTLVADGFVRDLAFVTMTIAGLSTIVFNANPLLRFDGYYILCDLLELPNLALRSQRWWSMTLQRLLGRAPKGGERPLAEGSERIWLMLYTPASWIYRVFISLVIVQWIASLSALLGFVTLVWMLVLLFARPLWSWLGIVLAPAHPSESAWRSKALAFGLVATALAVLFALPLPSSTVASGVVWLPDQAHVRTASASQVQAVLARTGQAVARGEVLAHTVEPALLAQHRRLRAKLWQAETEHATGWMTASVRGRNAVEEIARLREDLAEVERQIAQLTLRAGVDGIFVQPRAEQFADMHLPKGSLLAYVLPADPTLVRVAVSHDDIGRFNGRIERISVHLAEEGGRFYEGRLLRIDPAASSYLPSKAMGDKGGGSFVTDPADPEGRRLLEPVFLVDVQIPERRAGRAGARAWVKFEYAPQPLAHTLALRLRQLFLRTFALEAT